MLSGSKLSKRSTSVSRAAAGSGSHTCSRLFLCRDVGLWWINKPAERKLCILLTAAEAASKKTSMHVSRYGLYIRVDQIILSIELKGLFCSGDVKLLFKCCSSSVRSWTWPNISENRTKEIKCSTKILILTVNKLHVWQGKKEENGRLN